jgi:glycerophosphoryl diester phosphodiesterase
MLCATRIDGAVERLDPKPLNVRAIELKRVEVNSLHLSVASLWRFERRHALFLVLRLVLMTGCVMGVAIGAEPVLIMPARGICAHRGGAATHPENTVPAYQEAVRLGAQMVELDIAVTRDGAIVVMHDPTVNRTTDGKGNVIDFTLAEIKRLDAGKWKHERFAGTRVPTLLEVLAVLPQNIWINIDFKADARFAGKSAEAARRVAEVIVADGRLHQTLFAAKVDDARAAQSVAPGLIVCSMDRNPDPAKYVQAAIAQRASFIQLRDCATDPRLPTWIAALKEAGIRINYFYTNDPVEATRLLAAGVDFVLADATEAVLSRQSDLKRVVPIWR